MSVSQAELDALLATLRPAAPLTCVACQQPLDPIHRDSRLHPTCELPPPPSTINELRGILVDFDANSPRSTQTAIGPSEIAVPCDRRLAYRACSMPQHHDGRVKWAPMLGTAAHSMIAAALTAENQRLGRERWLIEQQVQPDPIITGSCDAYDTDINTAVDWKLVGPTRLEHYRRQGPGQQYEGQIQIYGRGWQNAGRTPQWVRIVFLPRSTDFDEAYEWTAPYSQQLADAALDRLARLITLTNSLNVSSDPSMWAAIPASPGRECRFCPYYRRGPAADSTGCPGDVAADERRDRKFTEGLVN